MECFGVRMPKLILLNKPFGVLCQFSSDGSAKPTLKKYVDIPDVYPAGRLDTDSEGLLALTDFGPLQARISEPRSKMPKLYWAQLEGEIDEPALERLRSGVKLKDGMTLPAKAERIEEPERLWPRDPPIRFRLNSPTSWLALEISEGKNRQVRRMTSEVGFPTLRLIRAAIGPYHLDELQPGEFKECPEIEWRRRFPGLPSNATHKEAKARRDDGRAPAFPSFIKTPKG